MAEGNERERIARLEREIADGLGRGENLAALFLKAMEALSLYTDNIILLSQAEQDLRIVYGLGLHDEIVLEQARTNARDRLEQLRVLREKAEDDETRARLDTAILQAGKQLETLSSSGDAQGEISC